MRDYEVLNRFPMPPSLKAGVVWAAEDLKPVSTVFLKNEVPRQQLKELAEAFVSLGLLCDHRRVGPYRDHIHVIAVSKGEIFFERLRDTHMPRSTSRCAGLPSITRELGALYGYPETAVTGFIQGRCIDTARVLRGKILAEEYDVLMATAPFRLSRDYWRDEVVVLLQWIHTLKLVAPSIYQEARTWAT